MASEEQYIKASELVQYDPETGIFRWKYRHGADKEIRRWNCRYAGNVCGTIDDDGYVRMSFSSPGMKPFKIRAHRLAWFISNGKEPDWQIDHINQNKQDNRIKNLRDVPQEINQRNAAKRKNNSSGVTGVYWRARHKKWKAQASTAGVYHYIGAFKDISDAEKAIKEFRSNHGFTELHGSGHK